MASITSLGVGSGLDLTGLLDQLETAERSKLEPLVRQQKSYEAKISAFGRLESGLSALQVAAKRLDDPALFNGVKLDTTGSAATAVGSQEAQEGSYQIEVTDRARAYSIATQGVADSGADLGAATLTLTQQDGEVLEVQVDAESSSLEDIRDAINAAGGGVAASIVNDGSGSPHRLVLAARETGSESSITAVDFGALAGSLTLDAGTEVQAVNAALTVNGIAITSQSNTVEDAIQGVTLNLQETGSLELAIRRDDDAVKDAIEGFVKAYNALDTTVNKLTSFDAESGEVGELLGNSTLRSMESRLRIRTTDALPYGELNRLQDLGISLQRDGTLELDDEVLDEVLASRNGELAAFFTGQGEETGFAARLEGTVEGMLGPRGLLGIATGGLETSLESLDSRYQQVERSIAGTIERYRSQFAQLDSMIASMNSTSEYLSQQFDMMNAQFNQGRR